MSTLSTRRRHEPIVPPLNNGDRLTQREFHRRYEAHAGREKFELIGSIVYLASPLRRPQANYHEELSFALGLYRRATPGVELLLDATTILGEESEPQPDLALRILPEYGGQSRDTPAQYVQGPAELLTEIAHSTLSIDMHQKKTDYQHGGVQEYLVLCVEERELYWFNFKSRRLITPDARGIYRSRIFPGLWIDGPALLALESTKVAKAVRKGLKSPEHARFMKRLQMTARKR